MDSDKKGTTVADSDFITRVREAKEAGIIIGDGHGLYSPEFYAPHFSEEELSKARLVQTHKSDGTHKGSIYGPDGSVIEEMKAVYNLSFLYWVARKVGVTESVQANGRGSQAQELVRYITDALA